MENRGDPHGAVFVLCAGLPCCLFVPFMPSGILRYLGMPELTLLKVDLYASGRGKKRRGERMRVTVHALHKKICCVLGRCLGGSGLIDVLNDVYMADGVRGSKDACRVR